MAYVQSHMCPSQRVFFGGLQDSIHRTKVTHAIENAEFPDACKQVKLRCVNMVTGLGTENI